MGRKRRFGKYFREVLKTHGSTDEKLLASYNDPELISDKQNLILTRLRAAWSMMLESRLTSEIVPVLMQEFDISEMQAYRDIGHAQRLFGNIFKVDKEASRYLHYHMAQKVYNLAEIAGDHKTMLSAVDVMNELQGVNVDDGGLQDAESLKPSKFILQIQAGSEQINIDLQKVYELNVKDQKQIEKAINVGAITSVEEVEALIDEKDEAK